MLALLVFPLFIYIHRHAGLELDCEFIFVDGNLVDQPTASVRGAAVPLRHGRAHKNKVFLKVLLKNTLLNLIISCGNLK